MASRADRAINMALRVLGIGEVERDFKRVGQAGEQSFEKVEKAANGADRAVSEYTARLRRVAAAAKAAFDRTPEVQGARVLDPSGYQGAKNQFVLQAINAEKEAIKRGMAESTQAFEQASVAADDYGGSVSRMAARAAVVGTALYALGRGVRDSLDAFAEHEQALAAFNAELALTGNRSSATAEEIAAMARQISETTGQTEQAALAGARALAQVSGITAEAMQAAIEASSRFADTAGRELPDVLERITIPVLQALADRDMKALIKATEDLDRPLRAQILSLAESGKTAEATAALIGHLTTAAGDGPGGLTDATKRLTNEWERFKASMGEKFADTAIAGLSAISNFLENIQRQAAASTFSLRNLFNVYGAGHSADHAPGSGFRFGDLFKVHGADQRRLPSRSSGNGAFSDPVSRMLGAFGLAEDLAAQKQIDAFEKKYGGGGGRKSGRGGGRSSGQSEADRLKREAEQARAAADRVTEANQDVIDSYEIRAREAEEKVGLEGDALKAVERRHAIEAAARRINTEAIEKEVAARRAEALSAGTQFDEAAATMAATAAVREKQDALRDLAEREIDAADATAEFTRRQAAAKAILEDMKSPLDHLNDRIESAIDALKGGQLTVAQFDDYMRILADDIGEASRRLDDNALAWEGFGNDVGRTLTDLALRGGSARDILQELIRLPLERLLFQNVETPIADWIDGLTGNNREKNAAKVLGDLPEGRQIAGRAVEMLDKVGPSSILASTSLDRVSQSSLTASLALERFAGQLALTGGGAVTGGGGGLMGLVSGVSSLFSPSSSLINSVNSTIAAYPSIFASGTDRVPTGKPFWVGENGRELMERTSDGGLRVISNQRSHRMLERGSAGPVTVINQFPERPDPRFTGGDFARRQQTAIARAHRQGLAAPGGTR